MGGGGGGGGAGGGGGRNKREVNRLNTQKSHQHVDLQARAYKGKNGKHGLGRVRRRREKRCEVICLWNLAAVIIHFFYF